MVPTLGWKQRKASCAIATAVRRTRRGRGGAQGRGECVTAPETKKTVLLISGMRSAGCRDKITSALEATAGAHHVHVSLYRALATIIHDRQCDAAELIRAVLRVGYGASLAGDVEET